MTLVLHRATLIDGTGREPVAPATIVVEGERIVAVGQGADDAPAPPPGAQVIDCRDKFVLPGLIDAHVHLAFMAGPDHPTTVRQVVEESQETLVLRELRNAQECLLAGITTVRDCGGKGLSTLVLREAIAAGLVQGPRILASGMPVTTTFGHLHFCGLEVDGVEPMRVAARTLAKRGADFFKLMATGGIMTGNVRPLIPQYSQAEINALCEEARRLDKKVAAHVGSAEGIRRCVEAGVNTIEHCHWAAADGGAGYDPALAERMAAQGTWADLTVSGILRNILLPDAAPSDAERQRRLEQMHAAWQPERAMSAAGVPVMVASDAGVRITPFRDYELSLRWYRLMMDVSALETLGATTQAPARALGLADQIGTVEAGKVADLLVLDADPLDDLGNVRRVHLVIKGGRPVVSEGKLIP